MDCEISETPPTAEEYCNLRLAAGMTGKSEDLAAKSLPRSLYSVTIRDPDKGLMALGRIIGDYTSMQIVDVIVHPSCQGQKLGRKIMEHLMKFISENANESCFVNLFADVDFLYSKFGFVKPTSTIGMRLDWSKLKKI